ncbi:hypothetical protein DDI_1505 [Dickeya dianthicola RNS04.9]|nr:hypothetical protein DDI_1505 [Dickeya dianthicola RNS04.9]
MAGNREAIRRFIPLSFSLYAINCMTIKVNQAENYRRHIIVARKWK